VDRDDERLRKRFDAVGETLDALPPRVGIRLEQRRELRDVRPGAETARPRSSATCVVASVASAPRVDSSAATTARLMAFTGGRSIVIVVTPPDRSR